MARTNRACVQVRLIFRHCQICLKLTRVMRLLDAQRLGVLYKFFLFFPAETETRSYDLSLLSGSRSITSNKSYY